jgi:DNA-binding PucR family transcriptional regulator
MAAVATMAELAQRLRPRAAGLAEDMLTIYQSEIPRYAHADDPHVLADMTAISLASLTCWIDVLEVDRPVDQEFLRPVLDVIRRRALQGVGLDAMMRAYRIAARVVWQEILELPAAQELVAPLSTRMLEFTDQLTTAAEQAYAAEPLRGKREPDVSRSALFEAVLSGQTRALMYGPSWPAVPHCIVLVEATTPIDAEPPASLDDLTAALVRDARAAYWTTRANRVVAACPADGADGRDVLIRRLARFTNAKRPLSVAIGGIGEGTTGVRHSYHEALEALHVGGHLAAETGRIHDSQELAPLAMLVSDPERAKRFAHGCLHPLGRLVERSWVLPTLAAYLKCQGRLKEVAAELAVHPSTVKYRLNELRPFLDAHAADGDQAAALLLAVRICEYFADAPAETDLVDPD